MAVACCGRPCRAGSPAVLLRGLGRAARFQRRSQPGPAARRQDLREAVMRELRLCVEWENKRAVEAAHDDPEALQAALKVPAAVAG